MVCFTPFDDHVLKEQCCISRQCLLATIVVKSNTAKVLFLFHEILSQVWIQHQINQGKSFSWKRLEEARTEPRTTQLNGFSMDGPSRCKTAFTRGFVFVRKNIDVHFSRIKWTSDLFWFRFKSLSMKTPKHQISIFDNRKQNREN